MSNDDIDARARCQIAEGILLSKGLCISTTLPEVTHGVMPAHRAPTTLHRAIAGRRRGPAIGRCPGLEIYSQLQAVLPVCTIA